MKKGDRKNSNGGFTIIEGLVLIFIVVVVITTFYHVFTMSSKVMIDSKSRLGAVAVANEKMEIIRNLDYNSIGTKVPREGGGYDYGTPPGDILQDETVLKNTRNYYIHTFVQYVDDPFDGSLPSDTIPNDYKRVRIQVSWTDDLSDMSKAVFLVSNFSPLGVEQSIGGGIFSINVLDNTGVGISQATVHIYNPETSTNITTMTDSIGNITLIGAQQSNQKYELTVTKSGYYSVHTYAPYPTTPDFSPVDVHGSVVAAKLNTISIITDKISRLDIFSKDTFGNSLSSIGFNLEGGRKIGNTVTVNPNDSVPVYDFEEDLTTDGEGKKENGGMSFGVYAYTPAENLDYQFIKVDNGQTLKDRIDLAPDADLDVNAIYAEKEVNSLLVSVVTVADGQPVPEASVELKNDSLGYDVILTADRYGQAYFPTELPELSSTDYSLTVKAVGFEDNVSTVSIDKLTNALVEMTAS